MITTINLQGIWKFQLDKEKIGIKNEFYKQELLDSIILPATTSQEKKGEQNQEWPDGYLTDLYAFVGFAWYSKEIDFQPWDKNGMIELFLERTRITHVWIDSNYIGSQDSLCTSHRYNITPYVSAGKHKLTILVDNSSYPTKGGHMTSCDTQTNWNGITGAIELRYYKASHLEGVKLTTDIESKSVCFSADCRNAVGAKLIVSVQDGSKSFKSAEFLITKDGRQDFYYIMPQNAILWSEHHPKLYMLQLLLEHENELLDKVCVNFGLRKFEADNTYFLINHNKTFLRGKHDGLTFPLTGYAPTSVGAWRTVFKTAKDYGINHYRFHTCCPPEAAFVAADELGVYLQPELPFWGTITTPSDENHDEAQQQYLIQEGYRILDEFGNHPSFVMMSLGNELWGSREILNQILLGYRSYDNRHLYTQGSNNFQWCPCVLEGDDFFSGVRFSRERLFRGSYAMCDAPQGHIQTQAPNTVHNYDTIIHPMMVDDNDKGDKKTVQIQYGTGVKTVDLVDTHELIPQLPVVSHEIGQYAMYPDYEEIEKYTGVLRARNLELFRQRLYAAGMKAKEREFFLSSGKFSVQCYKDEIETAMRSKELAGFQLLDLQDFMGQGTALVGVLDAFMDSKGLISQKEYRCFCSDFVLLAEFPSYVVKAGTKQQIGIKLCNYREEPVQKGIIHVILQEDSTIYEDRMISIQQKEPGVVTVGKIVLSIPEHTVPKKLKLKLTMEGEEAENEYTLWSYPENARTYKTDILITENLDVAIKALSFGQKVLYTISPDSKAPYVQGTYCTDFWNYPMFKSISESINKPIPIGTHGLYIDAIHPMFEYFPCESYTTPQWWNVVEHAKLSILDGLPVEPMAQMIDNVERNHKLGLFYEANVLQGKLMVCSSPLLQIKQNLEVQWLLYSITRYMNTEYFKPVSSLTTEELKRIIE